jgi:hypothetical protein
MAVSNYYAAIDEIITRLADKTKLPVYSLLDRESLKNRTQQSPSLWVAMLASRPDQTAGNNSAVKIVAQFGVFCIFRDARDILKTTMQAGTVQIDIIQALQGYKLTDYAVPMTFSAALEPYKVEDINNAVSYPLLFEAAFTLNKIP